MTTAARTTTRLRTSGIDAAATRAQRSGTDVLTGSAKHAKAITRLEEWQGCLAVQRARLAKGSVKQEVEKNSPAGIGTVGDYLLQAVRYPDSDRRAGD